MVEVEIKDIKKLTAHIKGLDIKDTRLGHALGNLMVRSTRERIIKSKKSPQNQSWKERSQATLEILEKAKQSGEITDIGSLLHVRGKLAQIGYSVSRFQFNGELSVFSKAEYSGFIQEGTKKMDARPFLGMSMQDALMIRKVFISHAKKQIEGK